MTTQPRWNAQWTRRAWVAASSVGVAGLAMLPALHRRAMQPVFVAKNLTYQQSLVRIIKEGLEAAGVKLEQYRGKRVLLKPNMVEPSKSAPHMTTHPTVVNAVLSLFRQYNAVVTVGEAPGHVRDSMMALEESGIGQVLSDHKIEFADLNYEDVCWRPNLGRQSKLKGFYFPHSVANADLIVSLPKMKTHHWMGVTASLKNMYGVIPGSVYGWPKNVLHHNGIPETVCDINRSIPPTISIVDGIECMEGDGPIMGTPKKMGLLVMGRNMTAVDATVCRLMGIRPGKVPYLHLANGVMGPIAESMIQQRGERWESLAEPFHILDEPHLRGLRAGALVT